MKEGKMLRRRRSWILRYELTAKENCSGLYTANYKEWRVRK
jgi:hypothetical protein